MIDLKPELKTNSKKSQKYRPHRDEDIHCKIWQTQMKLKPPPKKWVEKIGKIIRVVSKKMGKNVGIDSSKVIARDTWKYGMKPKCRAKARKKYGKR